MTSPTCKKTCCALTGSCRSQNAEWVISALCIEPRSERINHIIVLLQYRIEDTTTSSNKGKNHLSRINDGLRVIPDFLRRKKSANTLAPGSVSVPVATSTGIPNNVSLDTDPTLRATIEACAAGLSDHDKDAFRSAVNVMDELQPIERADPSKLFSARVEKILRCVCKFVDSVAICIQHNPEIFSLVVGGLRCVLLVSFEDVAQFCERKRKRRVK